MPGAENDGELQAIQTVFGALNSLDAEARARVIDYVLKRLNLVRAAPTSPIVPVPSAQVAPPGVSFHDIRSLKEAKAPRSANEMAVLAAYYAAELAPPGERKDTINIEEVKRYFKHAAYPLPKEPRFTLVNAKNAGYLDATGDSGEYRLNAVGYNLVVHGLPASGKTKRGGKSRKRNHKSMRRGQKSPKKTSAKR